MAWMISVSFFIEQVRRNGALEIVPESDFDVFKFEYLRRYKGACKCFKAIQAVDVNVDCGGLRAYAF